MCGEKVIGNRRKHNKLAEYVKKTVNRAFLRDLLRVY